MTATGAGATFSLGPPVAALKPPGECVFGADWAESPLLSKVSVSHDTRVFTFGLVDKSKPLGLSTCACILMQTPDGQGARPYTPVSTNNLLGEFQLMVKIYDQGVMTQFLDKMEVGQSVKFKHIPKNVKLQYPFQRAKVGMLVGGTGITPMVQALHAILGSDGDTSKVSMLYGSKTLRDILCKDILDEWSAKSDRFSLVHVLSEEPAGSEYATGFINKALVEQHMPKPSEDCILLVCGPPPMYDALCGPRDQEQLTGVLADLGYDAKQVFKF